MSIYVLSFIPSSQLPCSSRKLMHAFCCLCTGDLVAQDTSSNSSNTRRQLLSAVTAAAVLPSLLQALPAAADGAVPEVGMAAGQPGRCTGWISNCSLQDVLSVAPLLRWGLPMNVTSATTTMSLVDPLNICSC